MGRCPLIAGFAIKGGLSALFPLPREVSPSAPNHPTAPAPTSSEASLSPRLPWKQQKLTDGGGSLVKLRRIISFATLAISILTLVLVLKRPAPLAPAASPAAAAANAQSFQEKVNRLAEPRVPGEGESE